jgi:PAS domain S-box-containing protein
MAFLDSVSVLSVDDSEATRYARRRALEGAGFSVFDAGNGHDALAIAREQHPTVAILDIHLPDMDGFEICRRLKSAQETAGIAVLQISAMYDSDEARVTALEGGADAYLSEPVDPKVLLATVNALARMRKAERDQRAANRRLALLSDTASRLLKTKDPRAFMSELFPDIARELGLEVYFNFLATDSMAPRLKLHSYGGINEAVAQELEYMDFGEGVCGAVALTRERIVLENLQTSDAPNAEAVRKMGIQAYACHPLTAGGRVLGTLSFGSTRRYRFAPEDLELMQAVADQLAVALERQRLDHELQMQASRLTAVLDNTLAIVYVVDAEGRFQLTNRQHERLFGKIYPGMSIRDMFAPNVAEAYLANNRSVLESRAACEFEEVADLPDGRHTYVAIKVPLFDAEGRATAVCGISTDITRRKQAAEEVQERERRIRRLVDSNIVGVMLADNAGAILDANDLFLATVGYTRADLEGGRLTWRMLTPPDWLEASETAHRELRAHGTLSLFEKEYLRKDGARTPVLVGGALLNDEGDRICFVLDLSERKKTEAALRDAQKLESLGFLAGGLAHNLNNLLVGIMGNVSLAMSETDIHEAQERLEAALTACERAAHLASEMLAYAGKGRYFPTPINVSAMISRDLDAVLRGSVPARIDIRFELDGQVPELPLDANQVRQLVTNLVQNATEAIGDEEGTITVRTERRRLEFGGPTEGFAGGAALPAGEYVVIAVADNGPGIDAATQSKIFDPFFTTKFTGRGLGLSAAAGIARAYGGGIRVNSAPRMGSTFEVFLPAPAPEEPSETTGEVARACDGKRVVLVVDDEPVVQKTMRAALEHGGFTVLVAGSGAEGVEMFAQRASEVDLVLLDLAMPGMGGEEAFDRLRAVRPDVPIAICSGFAEAQVSRRFQGKKVEGFVKKPFTAQRLLAAARELVGAG